MSAGTASSSSPTVCSPRQQPGHMVPRSAKEPAAGCSNLGTWGRGEGQESKRECPSFCHTYLPCCQEVCPQSKRALPGQPKKSGQLLGRAPYPGSLISRKSLGKAATIILDLHVHKHTELSKSMRLHYVLLRSEPRPKVQSCGLPSSSSEGFSMLG